MGRWTVSAPPALLAGMSQENPLAVNPAPLKPGYLTTEFIGKCVVQLIAVLVLFGVIPVDDQGRAQDVALGLIAAVESFYALARGIAKSAAGRANPVFRTGHSAHGWLLAGLLALGFSGSAIAQTVPNYYIRPQIDAFPQLATEGLPISVSFRATTPVEIYWIKVTGSTYEEQPAGRGSFVFFPPTPGSYVVIVQTRDTHPNSPIYVAETRKGLCWDVPSAYWQQRRGGYVFFENAPVGQPQFEYRGAGWESDMRWFTVTASGFAGLAN